jgi:hypothetical protein
MLLPIELLAVCMAYFQLRSQGYFKSQPLKNDGKWRFSMLDVLVFSTMAAAIVIYVRNVFSNATH